MCFIGPCAAKKLEASRRTVRSDVDFVLTFEELGPMKHIRASGSACFIMRAVKTMGVMVMEMFFAKMCIRDSSGPGFSGRRIR